MRKTIGIIGSGNIGGTLAYLLAKSGSVDIILYDVVEGIPQGKSIDIVQSTGAFKSNSKVTGTNRIRDLAQCSALVITAGVPRKPGMNRTDVIEVNTEIIKTVALEVSKYVPQALVIVVTNPVDAMTWLFQKVSSLPPSKVIGMSCTLDSMRFSYFLAEELGIDAENIQSMVIGSHSDVMVPLEEYSTIYGIPLKEFVRLKLISEEQVKAAIFKTTNAGGKIVSLLKNGSASYSPATAIFAILKDYLNGKRTIIPCSTYLRGEYGHSDIYIGAPVIIGTDGVEQVIEISLSQGDKSRFEASVAHVQEVTAIANAYYQGIPRKKH